MININATLIVQVIQFLILVFILNRLMLRPILKLIDERVDYVEKSEAEISDIEQETARLKKEFFSMQDDARKDAVEEKKQLKALGLSEAEAFFKDSQKKVASIQADADEEAKSEIEKIQPYLRDEAALIADDIMEQVIGRRIVG